MDKALALAAALASLETPRAPAANPWQPITDAQAAEACSFIASGRPTKLANGGTVFTHGKEG